VRKPGQSLGLRCPTRNWQLATRQKFRGAGPLEPLQMRAAGRSPSGPGKWNKVQKGQKSTWASCCLSTSPQKPPVPNLCQWQYNACHIGSYFIHSTPCRIVLHPSILSSCLSHVKQHVFLRPITCLPEIEHPVRIHCTLPASAHVKSPLVPGT
jgi:hypothetical protein